MPYEVLENKIKKLPSQAINEGAHYLDYILMVYSLQGEVPFHNEIANTEQHVLRQPGLLRGKIKIADDFDDTPDCFEEYM